MTQQISLKEIHIEKRLRSINDDRVNTIAASINDIGLLQPIVVRKNGNGYILVAGAHRLEAARRINWQEISANVVGLEGLEAELAEIDENLMRNELTPIQSGKHMIRRDEILDEMGLRAKSGRNIKNSHVTGDTVSPVKTTSAIAAEAGIGERSAQRYMQIARDIAPDIQEIITADLPDLADSTTQLLALSRMEPEQQAKVVEMIKSGGAETVKNAAKEIRWRDDPSLQPKIENFGKEHFRTQFTGENEWYTPKEHIERVRDLLGKIDLDPASSVEAQKIIKATKFYTKDDDSLTKQWKGRVWLNPPYAQPFIQQFVEKLVEEYAAGRTTEAVLLTHNYTDTAWFHTAANACSAICFTRGRIKFYSPDGEVAAPTQGQAFFYFGDKAKAFKAAFSGVGFIVVVNE